MKVICPSCGERELEEQSARLFRLALPGTDTMAIVEFPHTCPECHSEIHTRVSQVDLKVQMPGALAQIEGRGELTEDKRFHWMSNNGVSVVVHGVVQVNSRVLIPNQEGTVQDGRVIDKFGDADLMASMSEEYLRQFWILFPHGRMPDSVKEVLPSLLLLTASTELALKSFLLRDEHFESGHHLDVLWQKLMARDRQRVDDNYKKSALASALIKNGTSPPDIETLLNRYTHTYRENSGTYMDARYFAEPTAGFPLKSGLRGC